MLSLSLIQQELLNENLSPTLKELCENYIQERTLSWKEINQSYYLCCPNDSSLATIYWRYEPTEYYAKIHHKVFFTKKFRSASEAINFVSSSFEEMDFVVLPPSFEV
jgi:hypothetical protein